MTSPAFLPYGRQNISQADIDAVVAVLKSDFLTQGPEVERFEAALAQSVGARHVVAYSHGTAALFGAAWAAGVQPGDEVITSPVTFAASANCVAYVGARPVFADVEPTAATLDPAAFERAITPRTRAVIPVHLCGEPAQLAEIRAIAQRHGLTVIEDAAHALGASYRGQPVGNGDFSEMTIFSFHPVKHVTTGEGGAVATNDDRLADRLRRFRNHGIERDPARFTVPAPGPWYHEMQDLGHNFRLTDLQAALGRSQLTRLPAFVERRRAIAHLYDRLLVDLPQARPLGRLREGVSSYHLYVVQIDFEGLGTTRKAVMDGLRARSVGSQVHYIPCYRHPYHAAAGWQPADFPNAEAYYRQALSLPMYPDLTDDDVVRVVKSLREVLGG
jgi:UDP-4-amino-4,6-dideoxy-N-acetyl-beta-L-altrosamine transaminase